jgi:NADP-dependent aldehyde dehydrogenase
MTTTTTEPTTTDRLDEIVGAAASAFDLWARTPYTVRGEALTAIADALDAQASHLIPIAARETHLADGRLQGELKRTTFQLRLFAEVLHEGSFLDARIDPADEAWPMGAPRPDLRRQLEPMGPVVVFAASNFPFAFSIAGGDTASALAAGCPVILKAHSGHPELSLATATVVQDALDSVGAPEGLFHVIFGTQSGKEALMDPRVKAGSFTGSIPGGRALFNLANSRPEPIPFYGELGSTNPVFVTRAAAAARADEIAAGFASSFTMGAGQFCTKPGVLFLPEGSSLPELLPGHVVIQPAALLNDRIQSGYVESLGKLSASPSVTALIRADNALADPPAPTLLLTSAQAVLENPEELLAECFGPTALVVTYDNDDQLLAVANDLEGQLTATIHGEEADDVSDLVRVLAKRVGRILWNQWPTGVSVTYAQQHGGPYPATTSVGSTSVGTAAINRFLRPVAYQGFPQHLLPEALKDSNPLGIPQRINGRITTTA